MLSSTRASALAFNLAHRALPAESSRQGLLRAIAQQRAAATASVPPNLNLASSGGQKRDLHRRRNGSTYATAVAFAEDERSESDRIDHEYEGWRTRTANRRFPDPRPPDLVRTELAAVAQKEAEGSTEVYEDIEELPSMAGLQSMMRSDPVHALRLLPRYSTAELSKLSASDLTALLKEIYKQSTTQTRHHDLDRSLSTFQKPMIVLRGLLHDLPSSPRSDDKHLGKRFKLNLLASFLRVCVILNCENILRSTLRERLEAQKIAGQVLVLPDIWATALANRSQWNLIIELLSPSNFPVQSYTPFTIFRLMQAHIGKGNFAKVPILFRLFKELGLEAPPRAYVLLVQASLVLGDLDTARQIMSTSLLRGNGADGVTVQLAILKGYRELGRDVALEARVVEALDGMEGRNQAAMLHALIRLRLDAGDVAGAKDLLRRFDCDYWTSIAGQGRTKDKAARLAPDSQTHYLAFRMLAPSMSLGQLEQSWEYLRSESVPETDQLVRVLIDNLARLGHISTARDMIAGKLNEAAPSVELSGSYKPGPAVLNTILQHSSTEGWKGLEKGLKLFRSLGVKPNDQTLSLLFGYIRDNVNRDPTVLANLANAILRQSPDMKPTVDHIDLLLGQAVRTHARAAQLASTSRTVAEEIFAQPNSSSTTAQAGLNVRDPFQTAVRSMIQSLRARGVRSTSRSLATRLRYDAQSHLSSQNPEETGIKTAPSVRAVWDELIARGYKPDKRHFLALMKGYADSGHMVECEDVVILAKDMGIEPTRGMWMVLMTSYGQVRRSWFNLTKSENAFHAMRQSEQGLDVPAICAMIGIYQRGGHRQAAVDLALRLIGNIVQPSTAQIKQIDIDVGHGQWSIPDFKPSDFTDTSLAITTRALRLDHPDLALQVISNNYPTKDLPTRVREVVKSIRGRARARITRGIGLPADHEILNLSEEIVNSSRLGRGRKIGFNGATRKIMRLFEKGRRRGEGGRRHIGAKAERKSRHEAVARGELSPPRQTNARA